MHLRQITNIFFCRTHIFANVVKYIFKTVHNNSFCFHIQLQLKEIRETIFLTGATTSKVSSGSTKMPNKCIPESCTFKTDFASLSQDMANEIINAIGPVLSYYCDRMHAMWHCPLEAPSQDSLVAEQNVPFDHGKSIFEPKLVAASIAERIPQHFDSSTAVKDKETVVGKLEPAGLPSTPCEPSDDQETKGDCTVINEQSMPHDVQGMNGHNTDIKEDKGTLKLEKTVLESLVSKGHDTVSNTSTSSFLHAPSFSQDSSNICSYDASTLSTLHQATLSDSSSLQKDTTRLKPCISRNGESMGRVFASRHCSHSKSSKIVAAATDQNGNSSTATDHPQPPDVRTPDKGTTREEFDFWGHGMDSDFEVKPPPQTRFSPKLDPTLSNSSRRKQPRSLNEAALDLYSSRRLEQGSAITKSTHQSNFNVDSIDDQGSTEGENPMQSTSLEEI